MEPPTFRFSRCKKGKLFHISLTTQLYLHQWVYKKPEFENAPRWFKIKLKTHSTHWILCFFTQLCATLFTSCCIIYVVSNELLYYYFITLFLPCIRPTSNCVRSGGCTAALLSPLTSLNVAGSEDASSSFYLSQWLTYIPYVVVRLTRR